MTGGQKETINKIYLHTTLAALFLPLPTETVKRVRRVLVGDHSAVAAESCHGGGVERIRDQL